MTTDHLVTESLHEVCDFLLGRKVLESAGICLAELLLLVVKVSEHVVHHRALVHRLRPPPLSRG